MDSSAALLAGMAFGCAAGVLLLLAVIYLGRHYKDPFPDDENIEIE